MNRDQVFFDLNPNKTYAMRDGDFIKLALPTLTGVLTVRERKINSGRIHIRRYLIREQIHPEPGERLFQIRKPAADDPDGVDRYSVLIGRSPRQHRCDCKGFESHAACVHVDSLQAILAQLADVTANTKPIPTL